MDPTGPSQPSLDTAYTQPSNPAQSSFEESTSRTPAASAQRSDTTTETRKPNDAINEGGNDQSEAMPTSMAYGARDASGDAGDSVRAQCLSWHLWENLSADHWLGAYRWAVQSPIRKESKCVLLAMAI